MRWLVAAMLLGGSAMASTPHIFSLQIENALIYDGLGGEPFRGFVLVDGDRIVGVGRGEPVNLARNRIDAKGMAVAPGFINMLSWSTESLIADGRAVSDIKQGVTLEVMGEGESMGPLSPALKDYALKQQSDIKYPITWTTLGEYLAMLEGRGIAPNVASFVGAATVRENVLGFDDVDPNPEQLDAMRKLVREAMNEGALGVGSSLIYAPASYAETPELIALATESAKCGGMYISHMRSEGDRLVEAVDELIEIARASGGPAEIYHLKQAGQANWGKLDTVIARVEAARAKGIRITADMYNYTAGATGLDAAMPTWVQAGGYDKWAERLRDPATRARVIAEMKQPGKDWENLRLATGSADRVLFLGFKNPKLKPLTGKTLAEVAKARGTSPEDTIVDLVIEDGSRVSTAYFLMDEANVRRQVGLPWMAFGSDAEGQAPEGVFLQSSTHPRAYGNVARLLGKYVRDEKATTLPDAIRRLTSFPADNLGLKDRGRLQAGAFADIVVFDPAGLGDRATYAKPQVFSTGVAHVFVNGVQVLKDGEPTGAKAGRFVKGPGAGRCS
ncbi:N-acyl-D-amino-acid deacylase family protein [Glacieibacterium frigidum]|uniref:Amidohydrolase family protein n=1 Tax=Glacieibacterium frigidum TaxID=2593303 RepID=A0A552U6X5_9SPHN|nr:amidohydrolase family protein [Glacieibacterium frigidum]TRW13975.1 amidohydrolase family protein [Glacieibacterium frigidum]